jgi:pyruvate-ferredoxin/flavodoxin oxidoreductase
MSPENPTIRGTAQNPDVYFQARETCNSYYLNAPAIIQKHMDRFAKLTGRSYHLFDYVGAPDATEVIVVMGSAAETTEETVKYLNKQGKKVGVVNVRLYRPFSIDDFVKILPASVKTLAVLDAPKNPVPSANPFIWMLFQP